MVSLRVNEIAWDLRGKPNKRVVALGLYLLAIRISSCTWLQEKELLHRIIEQNHSSLLSLLLQKTTLIRCILLLYNRLDLPAASVENPF